MADQTAAQFRLIDARLIALEMAVEPKPIHRLRNGRPFPPMPFVPGERQPRTKWLEMRVLGIELLIQLLLAADGQRAVVEDFEDTLEMMMQEELTRLEKWAEQQHEPEIDRQETIAMIQAAAIILMETHTWPLEEIEREESEP